MNQREIIKTSPDFVPDTLVHFTFRIPIFLCETKVLFPDNSRYFFTLITRLDNLCRLIHAFLVFSFNLSFFWIFHGNTFLIKHGLGIYQEFSLSIFLLSSFQRVPSIPLHPIFKLHEIWLWIFLLINITIPALLSILIDIQLLILIHILQTKYFLGFVSILEHLIDSDKIIIIRLACIRSTIFLFILSLFMEVGHVLSKIVPLDSRPRIYCVEDHVSSYLILTNHRFSNVIFEDLHVVKECYIGCCCRQL